MKLIFTFSRIITGIVFVFSGFVKAVDPVGTQIKLTDYFEAMGLSSLMPYALIFSFLLNAAELSVGLMLLFNVFSKLASWAGLFFMLIFTPLTFWLAAANPVSDCGCFGDAITLTNWQTFGKNVVLLVFVLLIFVYHKKFGTGLKGKFNISLFALFVLFAFGFQFYNFYNLPIIDFRPLKEGTDIKQATSYPPDAEKDVYEVEIYYKNLKNGESKKFDIEHLPYDDTLNWAYDTTISKLVKKGYEPPVHDFFISDLNGNDLTKKILNDKNISFILIMPDIEKGMKNDADLKMKLKDISSYIDYNHYNFYLLTSSNSDIIRRYQANFPAFSQPVTADYKMLKTFIRSNPGLVILKDGVILKKYHYYNIPDIEEINKINN